MYQERLVLCLFLLPIATAKTIPISTPVAVSGGLILIFIGLGTKLWASKTLGNDGFYFRDMFVPPEKQRIVLDRGISGPYRYLKNPMYGIGNLHIIGWALFYRSFAGIFVGIASIGILYLFYLFVELPHIQRIKTGQSPATVEN